MDLLDEMFDSISRPLFQDQRGHMMRNDRVLREVERNPLISPRSIRSRIVAIVLSSLVLLSWGGCVGAGSDKGGSYCVPGPQITGAPSTSATVGVQYVYKFTASYACGLFICYDADGVQLPPGATIDHYYDMVTWTPTADYVNKDVRFTIATPPDNCLGFGGNSATQSWTVHVEPAPVLPPDTTAPYILSTSPANSAANVPLTAAIAVTFSETVNPSAVTASTFFVTGPAGTVIGPLLVSGSAATLMPAAPLLEESMYTATLTTAITDLSANALVTGYTWSFATASFLPPGTVGAWGDGSFGQVGNGSWIGTKTPAKVPNLVGVTAISAGWNHSLALLSDGTVHAWGDNESGDLGDGTMIQRYSPVTVSNLNNVIAVAAGGFFSLALRSDGTVWAWGSNMYGQLGDASTTDRYSPAQVQGLDKVIAIAAGSGHALALRSDGSVWAWGYNLDGQLGDGTLVNRTSPVKVQNLSNITAVACGVQSLALKSDGSVWSWGPNWEGQLGDNTTTSRDVPVQVLNLSSITAVAAGGGHSLALKSDGTLWAWGRNGSGQLGDSTTTDRYAPVQVSSITNVIAMAGGADHTLALRSDGKVWAWGDSFYGQLGNGTGDFDVHVTAPVQTSTIHDISAIAAGSRHSMALRLR